MVSTPKSSNTSNDSNRNKVNIMSSYQDFNQYIDPASTESPQMKSGEFESSWIDLMTGNDLLSNDLFQMEAPIFDLSPILTSSMTTPSLVIDGDLNDSPIFNTSSFAASPSLDPPLGFFPDLISDPSVTAAVTAAAAARGSLIPISIAPSVTIPVDDSSPLTTIPGNSNLSPALNIPWNPEMTDSSSTDLLQNASSISPPTSGNNTANNSPKSSSTTVVSSPSTPSLNKLNSRNRKRSNGDVDKDPQTVADEAALKRAKNTDAARRSRERKLEKMRKLEAEVTKLKNENNDLQTKIAVLESEKRCLEDMNTEKDTRIKTLEQRFGEAHEALINTHGRSSRSISTND